MRRMFYKEIICIANSYKKNPGRCIAGKDTKELKWIRPVSAVGSGELMITQISFSNGNTPQLLDIIKIPLDGAKPSPYQPENILIANEKWQKTGVFPKSKIRELCDTPEAIWFNGGGYNDRIPVDYFKNNKVETSLLLIKPESLKIEQDKKARAIFKYNSVQYNLVITDPDIKAEFKKKGTGLYDLSSQDSYLCLSLTEEFEDKGFCYKLVAAIIG